MKRGMREAPRDGTVIRGFWTDPDLWIGESSVRWSVTQGYWADEAGERVEAPDLWEALADEVVPLPGAGSPAEAEAFLRRFFAPEPGAESIVIESALEGLARADEASADLSAKRMQQARHLFFRMVNA